MDQPTPIPTNHNDPQFWGGCVTGILAAAFDFANVHLDQQQLGSLAAVVVGFTANKILSKKRKKEE